MALATTITLTPTVITKAQIIKEEFAMTLGKPLSNWGYQTNAGSGNHLTQTNWNAGCGSGAHATTQIGLGKPGGGQLNVRTYCDPQGKILETDYGMQFNPFHK